MSTMSPQLFVQSISDGVILGECVTRHGNNRTRVQKNAQDVVQDLLKILFNTLFNMLLRSSSTWHCSRGGESWKRETRKFRQR